MPTADLLAINSSNPVFNVGYIESDAVLYSDMYQGFSSTGSSNGPHEIVCGQDLFGGRYYGYEGLLQWNTQELIPKEAIIDSVALSLYIVTDLVLSGNAWFYIYAWDYGNSISSINDWVDPATINTPILARFNESNFAGTGYYQQWTNMGDGTDFIKAINRKGWTRLLVMPEKILSHGAPPVSSDYFTFQGDGNYPKLSVTYHVPSFPKATIAPMTMPANPFRGRR